MTRSSPSLNASQSSTTLQSADPRIVLEPILKTQAAILRNLFELYAHDFSEHVPLDLQANGRFDVGLVDQYWNDDYYPFFIRRDEKLCGFAIVRRGSKLSGGPDVIDVMDVAEFFVVRGARKHKVGTTVAHALFTVFSGRWEIRVRQSNAAALSFWAHAAETWVGQSVASEGFVCEGVDWQVLRFSHC